MNKKLTRYADLGTAELQRKGEVNYSPSTDGYIHARVTNQRVIDKLLTLGTIDSVQHLAAEKLFKDYYLGNYFKVLKATPVVSIGKKNKYHSQLDGIITAKYRYEKALKVLEQGELVIVNWVVISDDYLKYYKKIEDNGNGEPLAIAVAYQILREALTKLAKHYGFK